MTHPKARTKPRRRERRDPQDRLVITEKGYAMLAVLDFIRGDIVRGYVRVTKHGIEHGRATPCAPQREAPAAPANNNNKGGHVGCTPAHPAGKSGAAAITQNPHGASSQPSGTEAKLPDRAAPDKEPTP